MRNNNLFKRCLWTLLFIAILIAGQQVILPNVDAVIAANALAHNNSFMQVLGSATGGRMGVPTLLMLGISPYMTGMVIWSAITSLDLDRVNSLSVRARGTVQNVITLTLALLQAWGLIATFRTALVPMVYGGFDWSPWMTGLIIVAGAMLSTWLADRNSDLGIGGTAIMLIPGLISTLPQSLIVGWGGAVVKFTAVKVAIAVVVTIIFVLLAVRLYQGERRIAIQRPLLENKLSESYLPIKVLTAGAMPFMFSTVLFTLPKMVIQNTSLRFTQLGRQLLWWTDYRTIGGILLYAVVVMVLGYAFGYINLQPARTARQLKESGDYIFNVDPGDATEKYLTQVFWRLCTTGNLLLVVLSVTPLVLGLFVDGAANYSQYFGKLFIVITIFDTVAQQFRALYAKNLYRLLPE